MEAAEDTPALITDHAEKLTDLPDDQMADILPTCRKLAKATVRTLRLRSQLS